MFNQRICASVLLLTAMACASGGSSTANDPSSASAPGRSADIITTEELNDPSVSAGDALQAVQRLRPRFLMTRGVSSIKNTTAGSVHVSIDGGPLVSVDNLSRFRPSQLSEIRYLNASDAAQRFGTNAGSGAVILVKSR
ncbi:MAG: hypothetical protein ABJE10_06475 [bacterium]